MDHEFPILINITLALLAALIQIAVITGLGLLLAHLWGWSLAAGVLLGLALTIASTVVMIRNLMDRGLLNTSHGQVAVGWLVLEDLIAVLILVLLPALSTETQEPLWQVAGIALLKTGAFAALMVVAGTRVIPWLLLQIAHLRSRELFIVAIVVIKVGTALGASSVFGVSLALGAFLAGVVVSESALSHQVGAEMVPFRETFAVLFFVRQQLTEHDTPLSSLYRSSRLTPRNCLPAGAQHNDKSERTQALLR